MARTLSPVVHLMHHRSGPYTHSYCGWVNFARKWPGNFSKQLKKVTCKRCLKSIDADKGQVVAFKKKLDSWKQQLDKAVEKGSLRKEHLL